MGDMAEVFNAMKIDSKERKSNNLKFSTQTLIDNGVNFVSKNDGIHLVINHNGIVADFWPSTGKYQVRGKGYSRGLKSLLRELGVKK